MTFYVPRQDKYIEALRQLEPDAIREFLSSESTVASQVFLQLYAANGEMLERWKGGLRALADLDTYAWGSKQKRAKFAAIAADPELLAALQGAVARGTDVTMNMLGVLALDGSIESIDALLSHLDPALVAADERLNTLRYLRTYAATGRPIQAILAEVDDTLATRSAVSPALALGPVIGLGDLPVLWFRCAFNLAPVVHGRRSVFGSLKVDCRREPWFEVDAFRGGSWDRLALRTSFTHDTLRIDELGVGRCDPADLPRWLAATREKLDDALDLGRPHTNLRGKKRERLMTWLSGG